ncbi:MAG: PAS domain-containing protein [Cyanobacteria bacterium HKST-UBA04]|nr:PAS domain-containing protein [Cyanobacteria bacterium HKST-UBA04]
MTHPPNEAFVDRRGSSPESNKGRRASDKRPQRRASDKKPFPLHLLTAMMLGTILFVLFVGAEKYHDYTTDLEQAQQAILDNPLKKSLIASDDGRTMSVLMAARHGDPQWFEKHRQFDNRQQKDLNHLRSMIGDTNLTGVGEQLQALYESSVKLDKEALAMIAAGKAGQAQELLEKQDYLNIKQQYSSQLSALDLVLVRKAEAAHQQKLVVSGIYLLVWVCFIVSLVLLWVKLYQSIKLWYVMRCEAEARAEYAQQQYNLLLNRQNALLNHIHDMAWIKDTDGRYIAVNEPFTKVLQRSPADLIGKTDFDIFPAFLAKKYQEEDRQVLESGDALMTETELYLPDKSTIQIFVTKTPFSDDSNQIVGTVGIGSSVNSLNEASP